MDTAQMEKVAAKIAKLLALADGKGNAAESESAWAKAQSLATEYQLDLEALRQKGEAPAAEMRQTILSKPSGSWKMTVIIALCKSNGCKVLTSRERMYVLGEKHDVEVVIGLYERIIKQIRHLSRIETAAYGEKSKGSWENAYRLGMAMRVGERVQEAFACAVPSGSTALVLSRDTRTAEFALKLYGETKTTSLRARASSSSIGLGYAHGDRVLIHKEIK